MKRVAVIVGVSALVAGCAYRPVDVVDPKAITLRQAIFDVADSLSQVEQKYRNRQKIGMYVEEATITFNISAASQETTGLQLGATVPATVSAVPLNASLSDTTVASGQRGNQIVIKFKNDGKKKIFLQ